MYSYDDGGNLLSKQYLYCDYEDWILLEEDVYSYAETGWKDLLVEFNGETITYDAIGNPLSYYGGRSFTWEGRELVFFRRPDFRIGNTRMA